MQFPIELVRSMPLKAFVSLKAGGSAEFFVHVKSSAALAAVATASNIHGLPMTLLGHGSNMLPSDDGVPGLVVLNQATEILLEEDGFVVAETGCSLQDLFLRTAQAGLSGLEYAVGIPGTLGGALVSNAGAYRSCVSEHIVSLQVVRNGVVETVDPAYLEFSYRDSILRKPNPPQCAVISVRFKFPERNQKLIYDEAREYQRQRIRKQPPPASAGSFFKNVQNPALAESLETLPEGLKQAGVIPAGFLIEMAGLSGAEHQGAKVAERHGNFLINVRGASATAIRTLATYVKDCVLDKFGVTLEEEVLYLGDWSRFSYFEPTIT